MLETLQALASGATTQGVEWLSQFTWEGLLANKLARAIGMLALVLIIIWTIALVYSGYARDSDLGPIAFRPHTNRRLSENTVVFDQSMYPLQMDGVEATCSVFYQYEDREGKTQRTRVLKSRTLKMHIRVSPIPVDSKTTRYGFETADDVGLLPHGSVTFPAFELEEPSEILPTPSSVADFVKQNKLEEKWTEDDDAPVVSLHPVLVDLIAEARSDHITDRAAKWIRSQNAKLQIPLQRQNATRLRANVFGSYYLKMQFSKRPDFVLFQHPNKELKMTAWLTLLTSVFSLAMDAWPIKDTQAKAATSLERTTPQMPRSARTP